MTPRQKQVLRLVSLDYSIKEIAPMLGITRKGVEFHYRKLCKRFNCGVAGLTRLAIKIGLGCLVVAVQAQSVNFIAPVVPEPAQVIPQAPMPLAAEAVTAVVAVSLQWDRHVDPRVTGYRAYWGDHSRTYTNSIGTGTNTSITITSLLPGSTNYFAVTALALGLESGYSDEAIAVLLAPPPEPPTGLRVILTAQASAKPKGPYNDLPVAPIVITNSLAVGMQYYRLRVDSETLP